MTLEPIEMANGIFSIIIVSISIVMSVLVLMKYIKYRQRTFIYVALTAITLFSPWWSSSLSFIIAIFNDTGLQPFPTVYFLIMGVALAPTLLTWMLALDSLMEKKNKSRQLLIFAIFIESIIIDIIFVIFAILNPIYIGILLNPVDVSFNIVGIIFYVNAAIFFSSTTISFFLHSIRSPIQEVRIKGIFMLGSAFLFFIGTFGDAIIPLNFVNLAFMRIILILSLFLIYCSFHLPTFLKKLLIK